MPTPHNEAKKGDIARIVLTAGDPKRCEYIANKYLEDARLVNSVRGMTAYTGKYKGREITVFPMGIGMSSFSVYAYELYKFYDVDIIIRIGTSGTFDNDVNILDTFILDGSYTECNFATMMNRDYDTHLAYASKRITSIMEETAKEENIKYSKGIGFCSGIFDVYLDDEKYYDMLNHIPSELNIKIVEMEAFALFYIAQMLNKESACIVTVVDSRFKKDDTITSADRESKLDNMIKIALNASLKL